MAMGRRKKRRQGTLWVETGQLARGPGHPFYRRLNEVLEAEGFDEQVERLCARFYAGQVGRPSLPPAVYFRLLLIGYFEGIDSERGIAWRVADSLTLREFLGYGLSDGTPDHSTISRNRRLIDLEAHQEIFTWVVRVLARKGLVSGKTLGVDASTLEANAALRSIVRRDTGEGYEDFLRALAEASGIATPSREELAKIDRDRPGKGSNRDWEHPDDPDARITRMKDGRTHLAHKAEHAVDLDTGAVVAVTLQPADRGDTTSFGQTVEEAMDVLADVLEDPVAAEHLADDVVAELIADKGYHSNAVLAAHHRLGIRTYISEPRRKGRRRWRGKPREKAATYGNRRRIRGDRGKALQRRRGELVERSFAHCYDTGGLRRTHLRGHRNIHKRQLVHVAGFNLGLLMRSLVGAGTPRGWRGRFSPLLGALSSLWSRFWRRPRRIWGPKATRRLLGGDLSRGLAHA